MAVVYTIDAPSRTDEAKVGSRLGRLPILHPHLSDPLSHYDSLNSSIKNFLTWNYKGLNFFGHMLYLGLTNCDQVCLLSKSFIYMFHNTDIFDWKQSWQRWFCLLRKTFSGLLCMLGLCHFIVGEIFSLRFFTVTVTMIVVPPIFAKVAKIQKIFL